jgi:hypothetical protein
MRAWRIRTGISITLKPADRRRLKTLARDRNAAHKHVWRAEIILFSPPNPSLGPQTPTKSLLLSDEGTKS